MDIDSVLSKLESIEWPEGFVPIQILDPDTQEPRLAFYTEKGDKYQMLLKHPGGTITITVDPRFEIDPAVYGEVLE